ncbi:efflux RND transporter periplasmic adaptor subunit [Geovibrio thiophilus]|uniref:Efflux RND transporter periplasmic adaptor subunit n=1 Tax=Geovibrio thiophilus TaxID=139438 RepID=A0A3R5UYL5_9BACT|nr:efflux RND transporter periplasmic adaptor subunit [Geovibrio thiophilus]QAR33666.1 efflux RND transporter periplasmic adaptor subunit [Geovibrio thiophilus]
MRKSIIKILLPVAVIGVSLLVWKYYMSNIPVPEKTEPARIPPVVITEVCSRTFIPLEREGYGRIQAEKTIEIKTETGGTVIYKNPSFEEGGRVRQGEVLFRLESVSYEAELSAAETAVATARLNLAEIEHSADITAKEWELWNEGKERPEKPGRLADYELQKAEAQAKLAQAENDLRSAKNTLAKTVYYAPFSAVVVSSSIQNGSVVKSGDVLGSLAGSRLYEVVVPFPASVSVDFRFSLNETEASPASVILKDGQSSWEYRGYLAKLLPGADETTGMVRAVVRLPLTPENLKDKPYPAIGMNIKTVLRTREPEERVVIPEAALREGSQVWAVESGKLRIIPVSVHSYKADRVLLSSGLGGGEELIVSRLRGAIDGMDVTVRTADNSTLSGSLK